MTRPNFTNSRDGVNRADLRVTFRLSVRDMASVLAHKALRSGVELDGGREVFEPDEIVRGNMVLSQVIPAIRQNLFDYGEAALLYEGPDRLEQWALRQVEMATGERAERYR